MAQEKKRLSKNAKAALKILNDSKLLANAKASEESAASQEFKAESSSNKPSTAIKARPDKKRG
ncbi:MAG: hypothetical protein LH472_01095 [Pyrinomonadaceae bacterium]|nr:hypothetical protein [Pyrinomonadaceae bacterium]